MESAILMNDWVNVSDDLPQVDPRYRYLSVDVSCLTDAGIIYKGFYHYREKEWWESNLADGVKKINVIKWQSL